MCGLQTWWPFYFGLDVLITPDSKVHEPWYQGRHYLAFLCSMTVGVFLLGILTVASGLDLSSNDLTSVPPNLSSAETRLDLNNNRITILRKHDFFAMTNLKVLNLRFNQIETIEEGAFVGLSNLYALSLYSNKIKNIPDISSLANLKFFWVGANPLFITHGDFENMKSLHVLDISWIWSRVFTPLPYSPNMTSLN